MPYLKTRKNERQFKSVTSITIEQFDILLPVFEAKWEYFIERHNLDGSPRLRKYVPKNEEQLPTVADKLFFILFYKKTHSLQDVMALFFDIDVSMVNKWIHILTPILEKSLVKYEPQKNIKNVDFQENEEYIIDGSERTIQRDTYDQKEYYSGKKGTHTVKNALIVSTLGVILWLGATHAGRHHDKTLVNKLSFSKNITILADLGFLAWQPVGANVLLPHKKPKNTKIEKKELTQQQKQDNQNLSKRRVKVENVLAHVKILRIVKDRNRNYKLGFRDTIMTIACSLHNFRLKHPKIVLNKENIC